MDHSTIQYTHCPFCQSDDIHPVLAATDYTVSRETYEIWHCGTCTSRFTQQVPDAAHIGPYYQSQNYISHSDTANGLVNRLYHIVRSYTLQQKKKMINRLSQKTTGSLLDIGAGTGAFAATMQQAGWQVTGLEPDDTARQQALQKHGLNLQSPDTLYTLAPGSFDVITLWHVLEHVHDLHGYFKRFGELLKPGGVLIIAVPNYTSRDAETYGQYWAAWDVPRHLYHFSPKGMGILAGNHGFRCRSILPMWFDAFYVSMLSEKYRGNRWGLIRACWKGLLSNIVSFTDKTRCSSVIYVLEK